MGEMKQVEIYLEHCIFDQGRTDESICEELATSGYNGKKIDRETTQNWLNYLRNKTTDRLHD